MEEGLTRQTEALQKLQDKLDRKNKELDILGKIFIDIHRTLDLDIILHTILDKLEEYFSFRHSMILLTGKGNFLKVVASHGYPEKGIGAKTEIGKGVIGTAAKRKQIIRLGNINYQLKYILAGEDISSTENEITIRLPGLRNPNSQVAIPLVNQEELIGVLSVESDATNIFKEDDEQIISLIANQAAMVIQQVRMYEAELQRFMEIREMNKKLTDLAQAQQSTLDLFIKYVPEPVVKKTLREKSGSIFEGEQQEVAVMFCDIRDFTPMSENLTPNEVVTVLNIFYAQMNEVIKQQEGVINQFIGDEIFVIFGAPVPVDNCEEKAVLCAIGMIRQLDIINEELQEKLGISIKVGIGINYGPVVTGNMGCENKISYSVTGDTVNTAKRIETLTKEKPNTILVSESIYERTKHIVKAQAWEPINVKGKNEKLTVYEVLGRAEA
ncbi:MAG TPA: adenylate/guanylate cyclase domain-containing protein [Saprospiraceae bacterium]|nr:adenylate/guanylate cyclase domain-containing protein [Saprospiraceae bacterium]